MTKTILTKDEGRKRFKFLVVRHDDGSTIVLTRRADLRSSKWSVGNVTPAQLAWALKQVAS